MKLTPNIALKSELSPYKKWRTKWSIPVAVLFPNLYSVGMSNLGFQTLFRLLAEEDFVKPLRYFYDLTESPEGDIPIESCRVIFISLPFELDYLSLLKILHKKGIPLTAEERSQNDPVLIGGGAAITLNDRPAKKIFDIAVRGDLFAVYPSIVEAMREQLVYGNDRKAFTDCLNNIIEHEKNPFYCAERKPAYSPIVSSLSAFRNMFLIEIQRSCPFRCGFCATPAIYGKFSNFSVEEIIDTITKYNPGTRRIGLVGSSVAEHPELYRLLTELSAMDFNVSTSSVRSDRISKDTMDLLANMGARSVTIAPETHVEHLYNTIGKHITAEDVIKSVEKMPFNEVKLYYIVGLPGEMDEDIVTLADNIKMIAAALPNVSLSVSVNPFIPKPQTKLGHLGMLPDKILSKRFEILKKLLHKTANIKLTINYSHRQRLEAVISNGNENIADVLIKSVLGQPIKKALKDIGIDLNAAIKTD